MKRLSLLWILPVLACACTAAGQDAISPVIGEEEFVSSLYMERPSVSTDSKGQPHLVCDAGGDTRFMKFHKVGGQWNGGVFAVGSRSGRYSASRLYIGQIEIDSRDRAWISCKFGVKEYGSMYGQGIWLFRNVATLPNPPEQFFRFVCVYKGMGVVTTDAKYPDQGIVIGTFGNYAILYSDGRTLGTGSINAGPGGEKVRARVASYAPRFGAGAGASYADGIWHTAMNGYSAASSRYQNSARYKAGLGPVEWAAYGAYPQQGSDFSHPGLGIDLANPSLCYIGSVFNGRLCLNVWDGAAMKFSSWNLKVLDFNATYEVRHGPAFAPAAGGGTYLFWTSGGRIKMAYVSPVGQTSPPVDVTAGRSPAATLDRFGVLHLVYSSNGARYRKILVSGLDPARPSGRIEDTRRPEFAWSHTGTNAYALEITRDGSAWPVFGVSTSAWTPPEDLEAGVYAWRVKEGAPEGDATWSRSVSFQIPPLTPTPLEPAGYQALAPFDGSFAWHCPDAAATSCRVELYRDADRIGRWSSAAHAIASPTNLEPGSYSWRVKSIHAENGFTTSSGWSPPQAFQVGVPGTCAITAPDALARLMPGAQSVTCSWTAAEGAASYQAILLHNGALLTTVTGLTETAWRFSRKFQPGYHTLFIQPVNAHGPGPLSPARTFIVDRVMTPGDNGVVLQTPLFTWTRSRNTTRYLFKVARMDEATGKFKVLLEEWPAQVKANPVTHRPALAFPAGRYRWSVTDYNGAAAGFTSVAYFQYLDIP